MPNSNIGRNRQAGFTLLEILVALVVLGFLLLALTQGIRFGVRAWTVQARAVAATGDLDAVDRTVRGLIERMNPGSVVGGGAKIVGDASQVSFVTELPAAADSLPTSEADVQLTTDARHRFVLRWTPYYRTVLIQRPPVRTALLNNILRLEISYWQPAAAGANAGWVAAWADVTPPALVRIRIVFPPGDARQWPDIVAAPMRERPRL